MAKRGFKSDMLRQVYQEAIRQNWRPEEGRKSGHLYVYCPRCPYREAFSISGRGHNHELKTKVTDMRRHGFLWRGRGGIHTADLPETDGGKEEAGHPQKSP